MYRFYREKILPPFLEREIEVGTLARLAGVSYKAARKALNGGYCSAAVLAKIAKALGIDFENQPKYIARDI